MGIFSWTRSKAAAPAVAVAQPAEVAPAMAASPPPAEAPPAPAEAPVVAEAPTAEAAPVEALPTEAASTAAPAEAVADPVAADAVPADTVPHDPAAADRLAAEGAAEPAATEADAVPDDDHASELPASLPLPEVAVAEPPAAHEFPLFAAIDQVMAAPPTWPEDPIPEPPRPNDGIEATLTLARHGQAALDLPISAELLASIIDNLPDHQSMEDLYDLAAEHPSAQVRLAVARKDRLGEEAVRRLAEAREFNVLERLLASDQFRAQVSQDRLLAILDLHPELARDVAGSYASFLNCAAGALLAYLGGHRDPSVRLALVENYSANAALLRRFAGDPDPGVRAAAKRRLTEA